VSVRVLLFAYDYPPMGGGIANALGAIAHHAGPDMLVSTGIAPGAEPMTAGNIGQVDRLSIASDRLRALPGLIRWARRGNALVERHQPAFLWAGNLKPAGHVARWLGRRHGVPYGLILYGSDVLRLRRQVERSAVKRLAARRLLSEAAKIVAISRWTLDQAVELAEQLGISSLAARGEVIPLGVDAARFHPAAGAGSRESIRQGSTHWLLTVCRLMPHKGVDTALDVVAALRRRGFDVGYLVAGGGPEAEALAGRALALGIADRVRWLGHVPDAVLPSLYAAADVYLGLSRQDGVEVEGFGLSLLEAAASGLPVIAGACGGTEDCVAEGITGFRVPPLDVAAAADRVERVLADPLLARRLGGAGRSRAESFFRWHRTAAALLAAGSSGGVRVPVVS